MKTKIITIISCLLLSLNVFSQDVIIYRNGNELIAKVTEVTTTEVKFKKMENLDGPSYTIIQNDIFMIKYENGTKDVFALQTVPVIKTEIKKEKIDDRPEIRHYSGPRLGITAVGPGAITDDLKAQGKRNVFSQFGWQFESRLFTTEKGISGLIGFVPLISMADMGKFTPSFTTIIGIRGKNGAEIGVGPSFSIYSNYQNKIQGKLGLVIAAGFSFKSGNVCFPVNIAIEPSVYKKGTVEVRDSNTGNLKNETYSYKTGVKATLLVGFNSRRN